MSWLIPYAADHVSWLLHCLIAASQCIVIGPVCVWVCSCVCGSVTMITHDNSKLRASILTKLGLQVKVHLQLIKFWPSGAPGRGSAGEQNFWLHLTTASAQCLLLLRALTRLILYVYKCNVQAKPWGTTQGRWPKKSAEFLLQLLKNAESNAEFKVKLHFINCM